jgi:hypothetical protein
MFQSGTERFHAPVRHKMLYCLIDKTAALARPSHAVNGLDRGFR